MTRTWPAVLSLYLTAPVLAEVVSGNTGLAGFLNPGQLLFEPALYGSGAILVRETVRTRGLGWRAVLLLGAAYGVWEEGVVITSWFNPHHPGLGMPAGYGRLLGVSWLFAVSVTAFHAVVSITLPILFVELLFPRVARTPWLGAWGRRLFWFLLGAASLTGLVAFGFLAYRKVGYSHPPVVWFGAPLLAWFLVRVGLRTAGTSPPATPGPAAPPLWTLRAVAVGASVVFYLVDFGSAHVLYVAVLAVALQAGLLGLVWWGVSRWSRREGWASAHVLALGCGPVTVMAAVQLVGAPDRPLQAVVGALALTGLWGLSRRSRPDPLAGAGIPNANPA